MNTMPDPVTKAFQRGEDFYDMLAVASKKSPGTGQDDPASCPVCPAADLRAAPQPAATCGPGPKTTEASAVVGPGPSRSRKRGRR